MRYSPQSFLRNSSLHLCAKEARPNIVSLFVALLEHFSAALSLLNLLENSLGRSKPASRLMQAHQHTVWNISTIYKPY
jgi:hypothetical protein